MPVSCLLHARHCFQCFVPSVSLCHLLNLIKKIRNIISLKKRGEAQRCIRTMVSWIIVLKIDVCPEPHSTILLGNKNL